MVIRALIALLAVLLSCIALSAQAAPVSVAIDVGHSLSASGAVSASGQSEFSFNLRQAKRLAAALENQGIIPVLIGDQGNLKRLTDRTQLAKGLPLLVSVHHDSVQPQYLKEASRFHGYSLFVSRKNPFAAASLACARDIARALQAAGEQPTLHHNEAIPGENRPLADAALGIYWFDDLVVLKTASQPAVLVEHGVIVNAAEEQRLLQPEVGQLLAKAVAEGIGRCVGGSP